MTSTAAPASLSARLRLETRDAHTRAERSAVMRRLLRGELPRAEYVALLGALEPVYEALESELDRHAADPRLAGFDFAALRRLPALRADLATLDPDGTRGRPVAAADAYARHLRALGAAAPERLVAHAYVRYLGDLAGGQMLARAVARTLGDATSFYDFRAAGDPDQLARAFRLALDTLPGALADDVVREAGQAFALHERLFAELAPPPG